MNLSPHFALQEFVTSQTAARNGIDNTPPSDLVGNLRRLAGVLEDIRTLVGAAIHVSSGYRCPALNKKVGGSKTSAHMYGLAADITATGLTPMELSKLVAASRILFDQVIFEFGEWTHVGLSPILVKVRREVLTAKRGPDGKTVYLPGVV